MLGGGGTFSRPLQHCKFFEWTRNRQWNRLIQSLGKTKTPLSGCNQSIKMLMHCLRWTILWRNNGNSKWIGKMLCSPMLKMIATTNDNPLSINGNSTGGLLFRSKWWQGSRIPGIASQTCNTCEKIKKMVIFESL